MTDFVFDTPERYDETLAGDGVWFDIETESGKLVGSFKCRLIDNYSQRVELEQKRVVEKYNLRNKKVANAMTDEERLRIVFCEMSLCDWKVTAKGKPVPFSAETAMKYFSQTNPTIRKAFVDLVQRASDVEHFQDEAGLRAAEGEAEKN